MENVWTDSMILRLHSAFAFNMCLGSGNRQKNTETKLETLDVFQGDFFRNQKLVKQVINRDTVQHINFADPIKSDDELLLRIFALLSLLFVAFSFSNSIPDSYAGNTIFPSATIATATAGINNSLDPQPYDPWRIHGLICIHTSPRLHNTCITYYWHNSLTLFTLLVYIALISLMKLFVRIIYHEAGKVLLS
uniref:Uncharacterized protein n=1 Tax=Glossina austeni TaxID=7395 RepID=A0A1A9VX04_GLOAU